MAALISEPRDARKNFHEQVERTQATSRQIEEIILSLKGDPAANTNGSDVHAHYEFLDAQTKTYRDIASMVSTLDAALQEQEEEAGPTNDHEMGRIDHTYVKMTALLRELEQSFSHVIGLPSNWFLAATLRCASWVEQNSTSAWAIIILATAYHCVIYRLHYGQSRGVLSSSVAGCFSGLLAGMALVALLHFGVKDNSCYVRQPQAHRSAYREAEEMVQKFQDIVRRSPSELDSLIDALTVSCAQTFEAPLALLPTDPEERMCVICLRSGDEVERPVKMPGCAGRHFLCQHCAAQYTRRSLLCPVCRM